MKDFSNNYTTSKNGYIFIAGRGEFVKFKPFLDDLSYSKDTQPTTVKDFFTNATVTDGPVEVRKIGFKVLANDLSEAIQNHKKFQKLIRIIVPAENMKVPRASFHIRFANLLSDYKVSTKSSYSYQEIIDTGVHCFTDGFVYKPEMDLGFFDDNGMFFAKAFSLSLDMKLMETNNRKISASVMQKTLTDAQTFEDNKKNFPGRMFGFPTPFQKQ